MSAIPASVSAPIAEPPAAASATNSNLKWLYIAIAIIASSTALFALYLFLLQRRSHTRKPSLVPPVRRPLTIASSGFWHRISPPSRPLDPETAPLWPGTRSRRFRLEAERPHAAASSARSRRPSALRLQPRAPKRSLASTDVAVDTQSSAPPCKTHVPPTRTKSALSFACKGSSSPRASPPDSPTALPAIPAPVAIAQQRRGSRARGLRRALGHEELSGDAALRVGDVTADPGTAGDAGKLWELKISAPVVFAPFDGPGMFETVDRVRGVKLISLEEAREKAEAKRRGEAGARALGPDAGEVGGGSSADEEEEGGVEASPFVPITPGHGMPRVRDTLTQPWPLRSVRDEV